MARLAVIAYFAMTMEVNWTTSAHPVSNVQEVGIGEGHVTRERHCLDFVVNVHRKRALLYLTCDYWDHLFSVVKVLCPVIQSAFFRVQEDPTAALYVDFSMP
jgi:hypothetical protein